MIDREVAEQQLVATEDAPRLRREESTGHCGKSREGEVKGQN